MAENSVKVNCSFCGKETECPKCDGKTKEKISKEEYEQVNLHRHKTNPQWNYAISKIC